MIITRTPFRVSFFGGGSDMIEWRERFGGQVIGCTINKYCFVTYRTLPRFFEHKNRVVYSSVEHTDTIHDIIHPSIRESLKFLNIHQGVEIHHDGDLPARSGVGSSSAFTVGLLNAIYASKGKFQSSRRLAADAYHVEYALLHEVVGYQDQILTAYGGFQHVKFIGHDFEIAKHNISCKRIDDLLNHTILLFTGEMRNSSDIAAGYIKKMNSVKPETHRMVELVGEALEILNGTCDLRVIGPMLHESWELKKLRGVGVSNDHIDSIYDKARRLGVLGGKLIGAGGAGFMILYVLPEDKPRIIQQLSEIGCLSIPFSFEPSGSTILYNDETSDDSSILRSKPFANV